MFRIQPAIKSLVLLMVIHGVAQVAAADDSESVALIGDNGAGLNLPSDSRLESSYARDNEIDRLLLLYIDAQSTGMVDEAESLAKRIVVLSIQQFGRDSMDTAAALINLADFQTKYGDPITAIQNLEAAIDIVERVETGLSMGLIDPLNALGLIQFRGGNTDIAKEIWQRAVHISHVNLGPHNSQQIETLYFMERLLFDADKSRQARKMRRRIRYLESRDDERTSKGILTAGVE